VKETAVCDSTCLIALERIALLDLLPALLEPIWAPPAVAQEFGPVPAWLRLMAPTDRNLVSALSMTVDDGEAEAIALACETGHKIVLDDLQARHIAKRMGLNVIGTVGLLIKAKQEGLIPQIHGILMLLERTGFFLGETLRMEASAWPASKLMEPRVNRP
jgi:predicted nucleic acid-binding protein